MNSRTLPLIAASIILMSGTAAHAIEATINVNLVGLRVVRTAKCMKMVTQADAIKRDLRPRCIDGVRGGPCNRWEIGNYDVINCSPTLREPCPPSPWATGPNATKLTTRTQFWGWLRQLCESSPGLCNKPTPPPPGPDPLATPVVGFDLATWVREPCLAKMEEDLATLAKQTSKK